MIEFLVGAACGVAIAMFYYAYFDVATERLDHAWQEGFEMGRDWEASNYLDEEPPEWPERV